MPQRNIEDFFGLMRDPITDDVLRVRRFTLSNDNMMTVSIINYGARVISIKVPDAYNKIADVVQGFDDVNGYTSNREHYFGAVIGRVADYIRHGKFYLNEIEILLSKNHNDEHHYNGGFWGFDSVMWDVIDIQADSVTFQHISEDGHEGYSGNLTATVKYQLTNYNGLKVSTSAKCDMPTIINMTNNILLNLVGHAAGELALAEHSVTMKSDFIVNQGDDLLPTGEFRCVKDTVWDFLYPTLIGDKMRQFNKLPTNGYDTVFCINDANGKDLVRACRVIHANRGRVLEVFTNQPAFKFYTANNLPTFEMGKFPIMGKNCQKYLKHGSFSISPMGYPNAPNQPNFTPVQMNPDEKYVHETVFKFSVEESWKCCRNVFSEDDGEMGEEEGGCYVRV